VGIATADASGSWAALAALRAGSSNEIHAHVLAFARELVGIEAEAPRRGWRFWLLGRDPGRAVEQALRDDDAPSAPADKMTPASWTT
jgi:hypothetical protein